MKLPLESLREALRHPRIVGAWLFGSAQDGELRPGSDLDIGVLFDAKPGLDTLAECRARLQLATGVEDVDLVPLNTASPLLRFEALCGRRLVCVDPSRCAEFASLTAREYEDEMEFCKRWITGPAAKASPAPPGAGPRPGSALLGAVVALWVGVFSSGALAQSAAPLYQNDFEQAQVGEVPEDFLVYEGAWAVREEGGNKFLELPGAPLETFAVMFGPTETENVTVSARAFGTRKGRRFPTFAVGLNGLGGCRLQVTPAKNAIELFKGDTLQASVPYDWPSGQWVRLRLQITKAGESRWRVAGKVWPDGAREPKEWTITWDQTEPPLAGRATVWASPFSGTPIRFDDLQVRRTDAER